MMERMSRHGEPARPRALMAWKVGAFLPLVLLAALGVSRVVPSGGDADRTDVQGVDQTAALGEATDIGPTPSLKKAAHKPRKQKPSPSDTPSASRTPEDAPTSDDPTSSSPNPKPAKSTTPSKTPTPSTSPSDPPTPDEAREQCEENGENGSLAELSACIAKLLGG